MEPRRTIRETCHHDYNVAGSCIVPCKNRWRQGCDLQLALRATALGVLALRFQSLANHQNFATSNESVYLPVELWAHVFSKLRKPRDISAIAQVCKAWHREVTSHLANPLWRNVWDYRSEITADALERRFPYYRVEGGWRQQVEAGCRLASSESTPFESFYVPARCSLSGVPFPSDDVEMRPGHIDVEQVLGKAISTHAFATDVLVGFERGIGILCFCTRSSSVGSLCRRHMRGSKSPTLSEHMLDRRKPVFFYDDAPLLAGIMLFGSNSTEGNGRVLASTSSKLIILIDCNRDNHFQRRPIKWHCLDNFAAEDGNIVDLTSSPDGKFAFAGLDNGHIRVVNLELGGLAHLLSMRESADIVTANNHWVIAANFFQPIGCTVWDVRDGRALHRFDQTSVGWKEITCIAGLSVTRHKDEFAVWNGKDTVRILNVSTGHFVRIINVCSKFAKHPGRNATEEAELGVASAHVGRGKMIIGFHKRKAVLATSNRVLVSSLDLREQFQETTQMDGARHSFLALSTDECTVVTAEGNAFGALSTWVTGRASLAASPRVCLWDVATGKLWRAIPLPSPASMVSTAGSIIAVVLQAVGQVVVCRL